MDEELQNPQQERAENPNAKAWVADAGVGYEGSNAINSERAALNGAAQDRADIITDGAGEKIIEIAEREKSKNIKLATGIAAGVLAALTALGIAVGQRLANNKRAGDEAAETTKALNPKDSYSVTVPTTIHQEMVTMSPEEASMRQEMMISQLRDEVFYAITYAKELEEYQRLTGDAQRVNRKVIAALEDARNALDRGDMGTYNAAMSEVYVLWAAIQLPIQTIEGD
ncbi:hypothetical protein FWF74_00380 [Candidatus Saccharibacteria bacterium]|nr:hypothetical protein [Candidatus Saccharibacteria bacterium]MCL1963351.1 hypothetical protein [Candidatus Saccharibacteria bacterium]